MTTENKYVDVNGAQVMDLTPNHCRPLALVDLDVLIRLTSNLSKSNVYGIRRNLLTDIRNTDAESEDCLQNIVHICDEFVAFHNTVNLIKEIEHPLNVKPSKISKADLDNIGDEC